MSRDQSPHPSASIRAGSTLVPETIAVVTAFLRGSGIEADRVPSFVRSVHATLIEIASSSGGVSDALHSIGYIPKDEGLAGVSSPEEVAAVIVRPLAQLPSPVPVEADQGEPGAEERFEAAEEAREVEVASTLPLQEPERHEAPAAKPDVRKRKLRAKTRERQQLELGIAEPAPVEPVPEAVRTRPAAKRKPSSRRASKFDPRTSVLMDYILCLEDGKKVRDLGAHIQQVHGMTPSEYRAKWKLPEAYPMLPPGAILKRGEQYEFDTASGVFKPLRRRA